MSSCELSGGDRITGSHHGSGEKESPFRSPACGG